MARGFQNNYIKNIDNKNDFIRPKEMVNHDVLEGERRERWIEWITFFRRNPNYLIRDYFGIILYPYQILLIWALQKSNWIYVVASRAIGKTYILAIWSLTLAVLYPGIKIVVTAKTIKQGGILLSEKMRSLMDTYPNVQREIRSITTNPNNMECLFHNGSTVRVVPSSENARGGRANYLIIDESRMVSKEILESVLKPYLFNRTPPFRLLPEYMNNKELNEEGKMAFLTSAYFKSDQWWLDLKAGVRRIVNGDMNATLLCFDYLSSLYHNIKTEQMLANEMNDSDIITVQQEYLNIPSGQSGQSYFRNSLFKRNLKKALYPQKIETFDSKKNPYDIKKADGEIRFLCADIATRANKTNDNSILVVIRLIPEKGKGYKRSIVYMESFKGVNTIVQARRIKEIFYDLACDYIVLDLQNAGISIYDSLGQVTAVEDRGIEFPPMGVTQHSFVEEKLRNELTERTLGLNPLPIIFPILASPQLNSQIAVSFRSSLQKKMWEFLISEAEAEEFLVKTNKEYFGTDDEDARAFLLNPYIQTGLFISECVNLDLSLVSGNIKLTEKSSNYKDRYSAVSYGNFVISEVFDKELLGEFSEEDQFEVLASLFYAS